MALIGCKYCGKEVSDKAVVCPHCGEQLIQEDGINAKWRFCVECGTEIPQAAKACPNCGWPIPEKNDAESTQRIGTSEIAQNDKSKAKTFVIAALMLIVLTILAIVIINGKRKADAVQAAEEYIEKVQETAELMLTGAADAETAGNLVKKVWYNSIYQKKDEETDKFTRKNKGIGDFYEDFNDALWNLWMDMDYISQSAQIKSNQDIVMERMKELKNPPEEHNEAYEALKEIYEVYMKLTNYAVNPTGSLTSYSDSFNEAVEDFMAAYNRIKMYY